MRRKKKRSYYKLISENHRAIRSLRLEKNWGLAEAGKLLGLSSKGLGHLENGRVGLTPERTRQIIEAYGFHPLDLERVMRTTRNNLKTSFRRNIVRKVLTNQDRRSYQKIMTKEAQVLRSLRRMKDISQDRASSLCGYSRPSIGHIENGRIELDQERINHIVSSYEFEMSEYHRLMNEEVLRDEVLELCYRKMVSLPESKLQLIQSLLQTF